MQNIIRLKADLFFLTIVGQLHNMARSGNFLMIFNLLHLKPPTGLLEAKRLKSKKERVLLCKISHIKTMIWLKS